MKKIMLFLIVAFLFGNVFLNVGGAQETTTIGEIKIDLIAWNNFITVFKFVLFGVVAILVVKWSVICLYIIKAFGLFKK